ncbi:hypothetical protein HanRHA438_Chr04g0196351 [Helianthus annuus]|nr:hypothetical protein HanRHA438_Chr04g0196351 [Helianthus annuus]
MLQNLKVPHHCKAACYIIFIDNFTRTCRIFFMKFKSEVIGIFREYKKVTENQGDYNIQQLRSDIEKNTHQQNSKGSVLFIYPFRSNMTNKLDKNKLHQCQVCVQNKVDVKIR